MNGADALDLAAYRRSVAESYAAARRAGQGPDGHRTWMRDRDTLFRDHPQSALAADERVSFGGLDYWPYDLEYRVTAGIAETPPLTIDVPHSGEGTTRFTRIGRLEFTVAGAEHGLDLFWLDAYGGGLFLPFRDATNGTATYGGGRYLLDTGKGADLGIDDGHLVLDFYYAYHPSCAGRNAAATTQTMASPAAMVSERKVDDEVIIRAGTDLPHRDSGICRTSDSHATVAIAEPLL